MYVSQAYTYTTLIITQKDVLYAPYTVLSAYAQMNQFSGMRDVLFLFTGAKKSNKFLTELQIWHWCNRNININTE